MEDFADFGTLIPKKSYHYGEKVRRRFSIVVSFPLDSLARKPRDQNTHTFVLSCLFGQKILALLSSPETTKISGFLSEFLHA